MDGLARGEFRGEALACVRGGRVVFSRLAFALDAGGALVLVGPNGSGKSSLLRLMAGLSRPAAGRLVWDEDPVTADPAAHRARLHYVGHFDAIKPALTARETLMFFAGQWHRAGDRAAFVERALDVVGIARLADVPARYFSAGQRRRLGLARLFVAPSPLWLLDEPKTALDAAAAGRLDAAIAAHRADGGMVVAAMHGEAFPEAATILDLAAFAGGRQ